MTGGAATVAVVIPTYKRPDRLRTALDSVLDQTYDAIETIVVDGDPDRSAQPVVESYDTIMYRHQPDPPPGIVGPADARDRGVEATDGRYVRFLDDDDRLRPTAVARQVETMRSSDVGVVHCGFSWEGGHDVLPDPSVRGNVLEQALRLQVGTCVPSTMLIERSLLEAVGPMRALPHDDAALVIELARRTSFEYVDEVLVDRGAPETSLAATGSSIEGRKETIAAYEDLYDQYAPSVRKTALARVYLQEGQHTLAHRGWSLQASTTLARAAYHAPGIHPVFIGAFLASLFGQRGWDIAVGLHDRLSSDARRGNVGRIT